VLYFTRWADFRMVGHGGMEPHGLLSHEKSIETDVIVLGSIWPEMATFSLRQV